MNGSFFGSKPKHTLKDLVSWKKINLTKFNFTFPAHKSDSNICFIVNGLLTRHSQKSHQGENVIV